MKNWLRLIRRQSHPRLRWGQLLTITISAALVVGLVLAIVPLAHADAKTVVINILGGKQAKETFGTIMGILSAIAFFLGNQCLSIVQNIILPGGSSLLFGPEMQTAWNSVMQIANVLFFVALLVFSIMIITRQAGYNFKRAVTALLLAVALANLSFNIGRFIVDIGDALRNTASTLPGLAVNLNPTHASEWFKAWNNNFYDATNYEEGFGNYAFKTATLAGSQIIIAYTFFRLAILLIERIVRIALLVIFAPIQAAFSILPAKELQSLGSNWIGELIKWTLVLPLTFMLIALAQLFIPAPAAIGTIAQQIATNQSLDPLTLVGALMGIAILMAAIQVPKLLNVPITALTKGAMNYPGQLAQTAWKAGAGAVKAGVGVQLGIAGENLKNAPIIGKAYQAFSDLRQRSQNRLETLRKTNEAAAATRNLRPMETSTEATQILYEKGMKDAWLTQNTGKTPGEYDNLSLAEKAKFKEKYAAAHPVAAMKYAAAGRAQKFTLAERRKLAEEIAYPLEAAREQLGDLFKTAEDENKTGPISATTGDALKQLFAYSARQADSNAPGAVGWKVFMNSLQDNAERMELLTKKTIEGGLGYAYPVTRYDISQQQRQRYEGLVASRNGGNAYIDRARAGAQLTTAEDKIQKNSKELEKAGQGDLDQNIRLADTQTLRLILNDADRTTLKTLDPADLAAAQRDEKLMAKIGQIMGSDSTPTAKKTAVQNALEQAGRSDRRYFQTDAGTISKMIAQGISLQTIGSAQPIAKDYDTSPILAAAQINAVAESQNQNAKRTAAEAQIQRIESGASFDNAVANYLGKQTDPVTARKDLINDLIALRKNLDSSVAKVTGTLEASAKAITIAGIETNKFDELARELELQTLKPGTANTVEDLYNMVERSLKAAQKQ